MSNLNDLYKEAGINPDKHSIQSNRIKPVNGKKKVVFAAVVIFLIVLLIQYLSGDLNSRSDLKLQTIIFVSVIIFANVIARVIKNLIKKNKNMESYKG